jgi:hypothetical protein
MSEDDSSRRYKALFEAPTATELKAQFDDIVGDSFDAVPPALAEVFKGIEASGSDINVAAQNLCDSSMKASMSFDELVLSCFFHHIESFCPGSQGDEDLETFLKTMEFKLPKVVWDWTAAPPPPPPIIIGPYDDLVKSDPEGMELLRETLLELWPSLTYVASQSQGSNVGRDRSADGIGYGPV